MTRGLEKEGPDRRKKKKKKKKEKTALGQDLSISSFSLHLAMSSRAPSSSSSSSVASNVQVSVRIRPLLPKELSLVQQSCITYANTQQRILRTSDGKTFQFDQIFLPESSQLFTYESIVAPLIEGLFNGLNATIFALGQTGSGKTHTMGTSEGRLSSDLEGISPRALRDIFQHSSLLKAGTARDLVTMQFKIGFIEIYNEGQILPYD